MPNSIIVQADKPRCLTPGQVAEALNCSLAHVQRLIQGKQLAAFNLAPRLEVRALHRIPLAALQRFLQEAEVS